MQCWVLNTYVLVVCIHMHQVAIKFYQRMMDAIDIINTNKMLILYNIYL